MTRPHRSKSVALGHAGKVVDRGPTIPSLPLPMEPHTEELQRHTLVEAMVEYERAVACGDGGPGGTLGHYDGDEAKQRHWLPVGYSGRARRATETTGWQLRVWQRDPAQNKSRGALHAALGMAYSAAGAPDFAADREYAYRLALEAYPDFVAAAHGLARELTGPAQIEALQRVVQLDPDHPEVTAAAADHHHHHHHHHCRRRCRRRRRRR